MQGVIYFSKDSKEILLNRESYGNAVPADEEDLSTTSLSYLLNTGSEAVKIDIVNCSLNGDIINIPASPINVGTSLGRPTNKGIGQIFFDTILNKPIWWTGTKWVNSDGTDLDNTA